MIRLCFSIVMLTVLSVHGLLGCCWRLQLLGCCRINVSASHTHDSAGLAAVLPCCCHPQGRGADQRATEPDRSGEDHCQCHAGCDFLPPVKASGESLVASVSALQAIPGDAPRGEPSANVRPTADSSLRGASAPCGLPVLYCALLI